MEVGYMMFLSNLQANMADDVMIREELRIAELAEGLGYDTIYCPEHHFEDYSMACSPGGRSPPVWWAGSPPWMP